MPLIRRANCTTPSRSLLAQHAQERPETLVDDALARCLREVLAQATGGALLADQEVQALRSIPNQWHGS